MNHLIYNGDCIEIMASMKSDSVDAIVTDPPYGLSFMGKEWDGSVPGAAYWREALRVAKPGAHLLCFGGTRTFHRMACAIEDAGWEIRDCIMWVYGSGFPKSMDVAKAIDKADGYVGEVIGARMVDVGMQGGNMHAGRKSQQQQQQHALSSKAETWRGWGTCLKPAWEPIIVARKPLDGTVAHNVLEYGTGALNIDGCRVPTEDVISYGSSNIGNGNIYGQCKSGVKSEQHDAGRFPANLVHDGSDEVVRLFPYGAGGSAIRVAGDNKTNNCYGKFAKSTTYTPYDGHGSAARFFYCAKASKKDRGEGNDHPTVKPNALMRWLVRLVCPQGGTVLDPFCGSGSTGVAAVMEGIEFVGIECNKHYCEIARKRIEDVEGKLDDGRDYQPRLFDVAGVDE